MAAIEVDDLVVRYGAVVAVDHLHFAVDAGEVVALLGPNGAGKTSTIEVLEGYRRASGGRVRVLGLDPQSDHRALAARIGVMLQRGGIYPGMSPIEALGLFAAYYDDAREPAELLSVVGLSAAATTPWRRLSGGQGQRLSIALALVGRPDVAFLDEPTAGVDPEGRLLIRRVVTELADAGTAVLLTTHELEEAERVADRVVIVNQGRVVAAGTLAELRATAGPATSIAFHATPGLDLAGSQGLAAAVGHPVEEEAAGRYRLALGPLAKGERGAVVAALTAWLADAGATLEDLDLGAERLEDLYLRLARAETGAGPAAGAGPPALAGARDADAGGAAAGLGPPALAGARDADAEGAAAGAGPAGAAEAVAAGSRPAAGSGPAAAQPGAAASPGAGAAGSSATSPRAGTVSGRRPARQALRALRAQTAAEVRLTLRRGDSVLLALGIPVGLLVFFSLVHVLPVPAGTRHPVDFLAPGILALAVMSTALVSLGIATGFERQSGVLKRLGATPLGRPSLLAAKTAAILAVEVLQVVVLVAVALALGWRPGGDPGLAVAGALLASLAFAGLGLAMAGSLRAEVTLAAANGLYLVLLLLGGMIFPLSKLPGALGSIARALPASALSDILGGTLSAAAVPARAWVVLAAWAVGAPLVAALTFRWE